MSATDRTLRWVVAVIVSSIASLAFAPPPAAFEGFGVVEFATRIEQTHLDALEAAGVDVVGYRPSDQLVAWARPEGWHRAAGVARVTSVRALTPTERLSPDVDDTTAELLVHVRSDRSHAELTRLGLTPMATRELLDGGTTELLVPGTRAVAAALASRQDVLWVEPAPGRLDVEDEASVMLQAGLLDPSDPAPGYDDWMADHGYDGTGVTVAVIDTGIDASHPDLADRVTERLDYEYPPSADVLGHGTHVAGIIAGQARGLSDVGGSRGLDGRGFLYGQGVAPGAQLLDQRATPVWLAYTPPPGVWSILTHDAVAHGATVVNASVATAEGTGRGYTQSAADLDALVRDAQPSVPGAQPLSIVMSAGNEGDSGAGRHQITAPKEAKNIISVGASKNIRPEWDAPTYDLIGWYPPGDPEQIAPFSSRGPALDGRVVPTVVAPGDDIISARSSTGTTCYVPPHDDPAAALYAFCSGTSMAAPHVSGAVALIQQWWRDRTGHDPSPAMVRALLVNTARDLGVPDVPNAHEGWGRVDVGELLDPASHWGLDDQGTVLSEPGEGITYLVRAHGDGPLRITLAWSDAPALAGSDPALVNDLDLVVTTAGGGRWLGNHLIDGASQFAGRADRINNIENVFLPDPVARVYRVHVIAENLPGDGVPTSGDATDQDYALVVRGGTIVRRG